MNWLNYCKNRERRKKAQSAINSANLANTPVVSPAQKDREEAQAAVNTRFLGGRGGRPQVHEYRPGVNMHAVPEPKPAAKPKPKRRVVRRSTPAQETTLVESEPRLSAATIARLREAQS